MGEFDDLLSVLPGDDWDPRHADLGAARDTLPALAATLRLPGGLVELRGAVPEDVLAGLLPLTDPMLHTDPSRTIAVVVRDEGDGAVIDGGSGPIRVSAEDVAVALREQLDAAVESLDPGRLHLDAACVEVDGVGILLTGEVAHRDAVTASLLRRGADLLTPAVVTLVPGSHTVLGYPVPVPGTAPSTPTAVVPYAVVEVVVHLEVGAARAASDGAPTALSPVATPASCCRLAEVALDRERLGASVLDVLAGLASNATHWHVVGDDAETVAQAVERAEPPSRRVFAVVHRFDEPTARRSSSSERAPGSLRVASFPDGAVASDEGTGEILVLTDDEVDALERLVARGLYVPDEPVGRAAPGPEAFGLPNCPIGATTVELWSEALERSVDPDAARPDGLTALAVLTGAVDASEPVQRAAFDVHARIQHEVVGLERQLLQTVAVLAEVGIEPILLGSVVHAHDGPLPPYFADSEEIDLLVRDSEFADALSALLAAGYARVGPPAVGDGVAHGVVDLVPNEFPGAPVRVRDTLATGPFSELVDHEEFHRRAIPIRVHRRWCRSLHPEHRFVHACLRVDQNGVQAPPQQVRDVVLSAPRADALLAQAMEASERWGATASVTAAVRRVDDLLPGLPGWLVDRSTRAGAAPEGVRRVRHRTLRGRR